MDTIADKTSGGVVHHSTNDLRVFEVLAVKDAEIVRLQSALQRIVDFPYYGAKAQVEIINIAKGALCAHRQGT